MPSVNLDRQKHQNPSILVCNIPQNLLLLLAELICLSGINPGNCAQTGPALSMPATEHTWGSPEDNSATLKAPKPAHKGQYHFHPYLQCFSAKMKGRSTAVQNTYMSKPPIQ